MMNAQHFSSVDESPTDAILKTITQQIWEARRKTHKNLLNDSEQAYHTIATYARKNNFHAEARIADGAIYQLKEQFEDAILCLEQAVRDTSNHLTGMAFFFLGSVYREKYPLKDVAKQKIAIECYEKALDDQSFDKPNWARNNLANIYFSLKNHKKAKKLYKDSLRSADGARYIIYYNLGRIQLDQDPKEYHIAIKYFRKSIRESKDDYDMKGSCYREMGTARILDILNKGNSTITQAITYWKKAEKEFDRLDNLANNHFKKSGKSAVVHAKIRIAKRLLEEYQGDDSKLSEDDRVVLCWWPPEETGPDGYSTFEERIFSQIEAVKYDRYYQYNDKDNSRFVVRTEQESTKKNKELPAKDILAILRGWGSASPLIEDASSACLGGGYFLKWKGKGIIIDPGIDFIYNFRANGFHMREVNAVIVSHDHTDHNFDLIAIDDIFYEMSRRAQTPAAKDQWSYLLYCDEETSNKKFLEKEAHHRKKHSLVYKEFGQEDKKEKIIDLNQLAGFPFKLHFFRTVHSITSFGLRLECLTSDKEKPIVIGFTCDTECYKDIKGEDDNLIEHLKDCDILIAHISQPTLTELLTNNSKPKVNHLGYRGVSNLIKECDPKLTLLGEFWAGFADMRIDIAKGLKRINDDAVIIPSSIGLFIDPKTGDVECSNCKRWEPAANIHVTAAKDEFGPLGYICSLCRMKP